MPAGMEARATAAKPAAILFDFDGVIVDSEAVHHRAYEAALRSCGVEAAIPFDDYADRFSNRGDGLAYLLERHPTLDTRELRRRKSGAFLELLRREPVPIPGAADAVRRLAERWTLAVVTGSPREAARYVLERFDLARFFGLLVAREDCVAEKPAPEPFLRAAAGLGTAPACCVAIEDSYKGLLAARSAGVACVVVPNAYTRGGDFGAAAALLGSMDELTVERIERLTA